MCCEAEGAVTSVNWVKVGDGHGAYDKNQTYNYVGEGCGAYCKEEVVTYYGWKFRGCCMAVSGLALLLALIYLYLTWPVETTTTTTTTTATPWTPPPTPAPTPAPVIITTPQPTTSLPYDCNAGFANWAMGWSQPKKAWCCSHTGKACPSGTPAPPNECQIGGVATWSPEKRAMCCQKYGNGCATPAPPPAPAPVYDCNAGFANWQAGWSVPKKAWCCTHSGRGCQTGGGCETTMPPPPPPPPMTSAPYDCNAGFANWKAGWSVAKKAWCCTHTGRGCETAAGGCA